MRFFFLLCWVGLLLAAKPAEAVTTCDTNSFVPTFTWLTPVVNNAIVVPRNTPANTEIARAQVTLTVTCSGVTTAGRWLQFIQGGMATEASLDTNVWGIYTQPDTADTSVSFSPSACGTVNPPGTNPNAGGAITWVLTVSTTSACTITVVRGLGFRLKGGGVGNARGWIYGTSNTIVAGLQDCQVVVTCSNLSFKGDTTRPELIYSTNTCFLASAGNFTVQLPTVSTSALGAAGAVAGATPFTINLRDCTDPAGVPYIASANWSFIQGASASSIQNTAASPAGNVQVQILDSMGAPIATGGRMNTTIAAAGNYTQTFYARYLATGAVTPGAVTGIAQYTMSYQ